MDWNLFSHFATAAGPDRLDAPLLVDDGGRTWTYGEAWAESARVADWLRRQGVRPGDRVTVQAEKCQAWLWLYLGCLRSGAVFHPLNDGYQPDELAWFLADARPALVVCSPHQRELFHRLAADIAARVETLAGDGSGSLPGAWAVAGSPGIDAAAGVCERARDDVAVLLYSSGTTGQPKGALITHGNLVSNAHTLVAAWAFTPTDCLLHALPVYHAHGLFVGVGCTLMSGARMIFLPRFDAGDVVARLPGATVFMGVPTHYTRLLARPELDQARCAKVRVFISGSAPLGPETFAAFEARTGHRILERYGMTETGMNSANPYAGERRPGTVGLPLPGIHIRIADDHDRALPAGSVGEIQLRGPNVFTGYWRQPEQTAAAFTADGWFRTGDQGRFSDDGYLSVVGRSKDLIISGGLNVYPREVELVLDSLPGVAESAVIGVPHPDFGEGVVAVIVPDPGHPPDADGLLAVARTRLAAFKVPKRVFFTDTLPRNAMGKVQKNELRRRHAGTFGDPP